MEKLFTLVRVGDVVQIRRQRDEQMARVFGTSEEPMIVADSRVVPQIADTRKGRHPRLDWLAEGF
jgi:hypothetical protein